jgi:ribosome maturation factor RimP
MPARGAVADIRDVVAPIVDALGFRLYDVEVVGSGRARTVRVLIDREGGVDLDGITAATQAISPALDDAEAVSGPYLLEVSSPGLERPLRRPEHFQGARGQTISITVHTDTGPRRVRGVVLDANDTRCVLEVDGERVEFAYDSVVKARTVFDWGPQTPKRASPRRRAKERS